MTMLRATVYGTWVLLQGCAATTTGEAAETQPMPAAQPSAPAPAASPTAPSDVAPPLPSVCEAPILYRAASFRDGLPAASAGCADALAAVRSAAERTAGCVTDSDCTIFAAAGGCMGVPVSTRAATKLVALDAACAEGNDCWSADYTDHHLRCQSGCCAAVEH